MFAQPYYDLSVKLAKWGHIMELIYFGDMAPPGCAHGGGIATSSAYKYTMVLYLDI